MAIVGCSFFGGGKSQQVPAELGSNPGLLGVRQVWTTAVGSINGLQLDPYVQEDTVTFASVEGTVSVVNARTGSVVWRAELKEPLSVGVGGSGTLRSVVSRDGQLILIDDGRELWRQRLPAQTFTAPLVAGGRVFVLTADRSIHAFDAQTGQRLWVRQRQGEALVLRQAGVLTPMGNTLLAGLGGRLSGLNPDNGSTRWEIPIANPRGANDIDRLVELTGPANRAGDSVCVRAFPASLACTDAVRGVLVWAIPATGAEGIHGDAEHVFASEANGTVMALSRADGGKLWSSDVLKFRRLTSPLLLGRSVVLADQSGAVHMLSRADGTVLDRAVTDSSGVTIRPVAAAGTLVVISRNGNVYGFRPQ
jgi:outer membrane assembly lipoprotein YfgL